MAWTYVAQASGYAIGSGTTIDIDTGTLHLEVGDVLIAVASWGGGTSTLSIATTAPADSFTVQARANYSTRNYLSVAHVIVGTHDAAATIRATLGTARAEKTLCVYQFRPDAGETVSVVAGPAPGSGGSGSAMVSGNISPAGTDLLVFVGAHNASGVTTTAEQIADLNAAGYIRRGRCSLFYSLFTSSQTNIHGQCSFGDDDSWVIDILALESASAGGISIPVVINHLRTQGVL